jgi:Zn-finger nucleic acid-binding protein
MKTCPNCSQQHLRKTTIASIEVDECPKCKGLWFEDQELRLAKDHTDRDLVWMDFEIWKHPDRFQVEQRPLRCPGCGSQLVGIQYGSTGVTVNYCKACRGLWLDKGEFKRIVRALTDELSSKSAAEYVRASLQEAEEMFTGPESFLSEWSDLRAVLRLLQLRFFVEHPGLMGSIMGLPLR